MTQSRAGAPDKSRRKPKSNPKSSPKAASRPVHTNAHPAIMQTLLDEHGYMATLLATVEDKLSALESGKQLDPHIVYEALHYMTQYPDRFHHPREDLVYQRACEVSTVLEDDVDTLQHEHDALARAGRKLLSVLGRANRGETPIKSVISPAREYIDTMRRHMEIEESYVFPRIEQALEARDWEELAREELLEPVADPLFGPVIDRQYRNIARSLRRGLRERTEDLVFAEWLGVEGALEAMDILSLGADNSRGLIRERLRDVMRENGEIVREMGASLPGFLFTPLVCSLATTRHSIGLLSDLAELSRDIADDIGDVRRNYKQQKKNLGRGAKNDKQAPHTVH